MISHEPLRELADANKAIDRLEAELRGREIRTKLLLERIALLEAKAAVCDAILDADEYSWRWTAGAPQRDCERFELAADALRELQEKTK